MKRLTLLLILSPLFLFGQTRQSAIVDSIKTAGRNLAAVSQMIGKMPGAMVDRIGVSDSDEYVTLTVRIHVDGASVIANLPLTRFARIAAAVRTASPAQLIPALPPFIPVLEKDTVTALPLRMIAQLKTRNAIASETKETVVPVFPFEPEEPEALPLIDNTRFVIEMPRPARPAAVNVPVFEEKKMPVEEMHLSDEGYSLLEKMEGFSPELYSLKDGGFTIGYGFFVPYGEAGKWSKGVTLEEAERIIREKVPAYEDQVKQYINVPLTQTEFDALTMLAYNLGGFSKATSIVNDINGGGDFGKLQRDWMRFVHSKAPNVMKGLMNRRKDELRVRNEMNYQPERKLLIYKNNR